jgi:carbon storage regulator CsrA
MALWIEDRKEGTSMLTLTRRINERVRLLLPDGVEVWVMVVDIAPGKVRLGIEAPPSVEIMRQELLPPVTPPGTSPGGRK